MLDHAHGAGGLIVKAENYRGVKLRVKKGRQWGYLNANINGHNWGDHLSTSEEKLLATLRGYVDSAIERPDAFESHWLPGHKGVSDPSAWQGHRCKESA